MSQDPHTAVECHFRATVPLGSVEGTLKTLREYERAGVVDELSVGTWPHEISLTEETAGEAALRSYERFRTWADDEGVSLGPRFVRRERSTLTEDAGDVVLVLPVLCLSVSVDGELLSVAPHSTETETYTVEDALGHLGSLPRVLPSEDVSKLPSGHPARSALVSEWPDESNVS